jgi:hypothetical protein
VSTIRNEMVRNIMKSIMDEKREDGEKEVRLNAIMEKSIT